MALNNAKKVAEVEALERKFDLGQLQGADQLATFNNGEALKSLKDIGLISDKIADDIGKLMPDHEVRYSQAVSASVSEGMEHADALRKAIFDVYGPFIFREVELDDGEVAALNAVLEKEDADKGLSSSPELKVAVIRAKKMFDGMGKKRQAAGMTGGNAGLNGISFEEFLKESTGGAGDSELAEKVAEKKQELTNKEAALKNFSNDEAYFKGKKYEVLKSMFGRLPVGLDSSMETGPIEATYAGLDAKSRQLNVMMTSSNQRGSILNETQWAQAKDDLDKAEAGKLALGALKGSIGPIIKQTQSLLAAVKRFNSLGLLTMDIGTVETMLEAAVDDPQGVSVSSLRELGTKVDELTTAVEAAGTFDVTAAKASIEASKTELKKDEKLLAVQGQKISSVEAARRIMTTLVAADEDFKALPFEKQQQVARFALARDLALLDTEENFGAVAARGSAKVAELMGDLRSKERMLNFSFQVGDNTESPLKGLKVEDFKSLDSIRDKIDRKVINKSNVFYLIAFFESFEQEQGVVSMQRVELEKAAKRIIAREVGAEDRMDDARVVKLVREAYDEMLADAETLVGDYNGHYNEKKGDWQKAEIARFQLELEALREKYITKEIDRDEYEKEVDEVLEKARDSEIEGDLGITRDELLNQFMISPESQALKDFGFSVKEWAAGKAKAVGMAGLSLAGKGVVGTGKLAGSLAFQAALTPFRAVKWGALIAAKPLVGFINLFRKSPWQPYSLKETAANDVGRVKDYISGKFSGAVNGTMENITTIPAEKWGEVSYKYTKLSEREGFESKKTKRAAELEAKLKDSSKTPVKSDVVPQFDLSEYKATLANLK